MITFVKHNIHLLLAIGLALGMALNLQRNFAASERRNTEMHQESMRHRARLDAENRQSIEDRRRIAADLDRIERALELALARTPHTPAGTSHP